MTPEEHTSLVCEARDMMAREPGEGETERMEFTIDTLRRLSSDEFRIVMSFFCRDCGGPSGCQCWNDE